MSRVFSYPITKEAAGQRVLDYLKALGYSRNILMQIKGTPGGLLLDGKKPFGTTILMEGSLLTVRLEEQEVSRILPIKLPLSILHEDKDLLIVNKAADTPIHPSHGNHENTLANAAAWYFQEKGEPFVYRCINRLDRDTTGALILAKHALCASLLGAQIKEHKIRRTYLAITDGIPPACGSICAPIGRKKGSAIEREVDYENGEAACTHYERLSIHEERSLLMLRLETGRTHQIRVHMKHLGYPLLGDYLYYPHYERIQRQALHSYQLEFTHPITGERLCITAPVPEDFAKAF